MPSTLEYILSMLLGSIWRASSRIITSVKQVYDRLYAIKTLGEISNDDSGNIIAVVICFKAMLRHQLSTFTWMPILPSNLACMGRATSDH